MTAYTDIIVSNLEGTQNILENAVASVSCRKGQVFRLKVKKKRGLTPAERTALGLLKHGDFCRVLTVNFQDSMVFPVFEAELVAGPRSGELQFGKVRSMSFRYRGCT